MENGILGILKVNSINYTPRFLNNAEDKIPTESSSKKAGDFSEILNQAIEKTVDSSVYCQTTTYGSDSEHRDFHYMTREYNY